MKYFQMTFSDYCQSTAAYWHAQLETGEQPTMFSSHVEGQNAEVWIEDEDADVLYRFALWVLGIAFTESDTRKLTDKGFGM